jgi:hypothetical protein
MGGRPLRGICRLWGNDGGIRCGGGGSMSSVDTGAGSRGGERRSSSVGCVSSAA